MGRLGTKLRNVEVADGKAIAYWCPGCNHAHVLRIRPDTSGKPSWDWDGNVDKPTFTPSVLVMVEWSKDLEPGDNPADNQDEVCHSLVVQGRIQFLGDCTHTLKGQTVDLPDWTPENDDSTRWLVNK